MVDLNVPNFITIGLISIGALIAVKAAGRLAGIDVGRYV